MKAVGVSSSKNIHDLTFQTFVLCLDILSLAIPQKKKSIALKSW
jgi:hypothetical protein